MPIIRELEHLKQFEEIEKRIQAQMRNMLYAGFLLGCMLLALFGILLFISHMMSFDGGGRFKVRLERVPQEALDLPCPSTFHQQTLHATNLPAHTGLEAYNSPAAILAPHHRAPFSADLPAVHRPDARMPKCAQTIS